MSSSGSFLDPSEFLEILAIQIPPIRFVFQVTQKDLRSSLMMAGYCRNMYEPVYRIKEW
jgi:hypothetical protein